MGYNLNQNYTRDSKSNVEFLTALHDEKNKVIDKRTQYITNKLAFTTGLFGLGSLQLITPQVPWVLLLVPLIALGYDVQINHTDLKIKKIGAFIRTRVEDVSALEKDWEDFMRKNRDGLSTYADSVFTIFTISVIAVLVWFTSIPSVLFANVYWIWLFSSICVAILLYVRRSFLIQSLDAKTTDLISNMKCRSMIGKKIAILGTKSGIDEELVKNIAAMGATVYFSTENLALGSYVETKVKRDTQNSKIFFFETNMFTKHEEQEVLSDKFTKQCIEENIDGLIIQSEIWDHPDISFQHAAHDIFFSNFNVPYNFIKSLVKRSQKRGQPIVQVLVWQAPHNCVLFRRKVTQIFKNPSNTPSNTKGQEMKEVEEGLESIIPSRRWVIPFISSAIYHVSKNYSSIFNNGIKIVHQRCSLCKFWFDLWGWESNFFSETCRFLVDSI